VSAIVLLEDRAGDASSVFVGTVDLSDDGVDAPFVLVIY